ncbi:MAG: hypothetical protein ACYC8T_37495 [Myxococcaceae bacterium]
MVHSRESRMTRGHSLFCLLVILVLTLSTRAGAQDEQPEHRHCVGWAILGAVAGGQIGSLGAQGAFRLAGESLDNPAHGMRNGLLVGLSTGVGLALGPMATCGLWGDEPHLVPAATFILGGAVIGAATFLGAALLIEGSASRNLFSTEAGPYLAMMAVAAGAMVGGGGGDALHRTRERRASPTVKVVVLPLVGPGQTGLTIAAVL